MVCPIKLGLWVIWVRYYYCKKKIGRYEIYYLGQRIFYHCAPKTLLGLREIRKKGNSPLHHWRRKIVFVLRGSGIIFEIAQKRISVSGAGSGDGRWKSSVYGVKVLLRNPLRDLQISIQLP
jgi:hypothetical protein